MWSRFETCEMACDLILLDSGIILVRFSKLNENKYGSTKRQTSMQIWTSATVMSNPS